MKECIPNVWVSECIQVLPCPYVCPFSLALDMESSPKELQDSAVCPPVLGQVREFRSQKGTSPNLLVLPAAPASPQTPCLGPGFGPSPLAWHLRGPGSHLQTHFVLTLGSPPPNRRQGLQSLASNT